MDLAAAGGGNCELTKPGEIYTTPNGETGLLIWGLGFRVEGLGFRVKGFKRGTTRSMQYAIILHHLSMHTYTYTYICSVSK